MTDQYPEHEKPAKIAERSRIRQVWCETGLQSGEPIEWEADAAELLKAVDSTLGFRRERRVCPTIVVVHMRETPELLARLAGEWSDAYDRYVVFRVTRSG